MRGLLFAALLAAAPAAAQSPTEGGAALDIQAAAATLTPDLLDGVALDGAWVLTADHPAFGGLSGLIVEDGALTAVTDQAHWLTARIDPGDGALAGARIAPILGRTRAILDKAGGDAESLTRRGGDLLLGLEQDHRIARHLGAGRIGGDLRSPAFRGLGGNAGLEALATLPGGRLIALAEGTADAATAVFVIARDGSVTRGTLPRTTPHVVTAADLGRDGRLYTAWRHYDPQVGVAIEVRRHDLGADGLPLAETGRTLAAFGPGSGIDNIEALALDGPRLWLVSDDNFNPLQRTILVGLTLAP